MANDIDHLLKHWAAWARDNGNWRKMSRSIEHRYAFDPERYQFEDDKEKQYQFRYDIRTAEKVEVIAAKLPDIEHMVLVAAYVYFPHYQDKDVARKLKMSASAYTSHLDLAVFKIWRNYAR